MYASKYGGDTYLFKLLTILICFLVLIYNYHKRQIVSSSSIWVLGYMLIMVIYPLYAVDVDYKNEQIIDYCALGGSFCFFIGNILGHRFRIRKRRLVQGGSTCYLIPNFNVSMIAFWVTLFLSIICLLYLIGIEGISLILQGISTSKHFALHGDKDNSIYVFSIHLMVPCILGMWISATNKWERRFRIFALIVYILETVLFGFTRIFLITILSIIVIYEMRNLNRRKQTLYSFICVLVVMMVLVLMNFVRSLGLGKMNSFNQYLNLDYFFESTDFGASYFWLDKLLDITPPYISPIVYLKPIFMFIPRSLWPTKPEPLSLQILQIIDPIRAASGYSTAGNSVIGEGYAIMGHVGLFLYPLIWGIICASLDRNFYERLLKGKDRSLKNVFYYIYAVFIVVSAQRGDWSQYMGIVCWFYFLPLYILSRVSFRIKQRN